MDRRTFLKALAGTAAVAAVAPQALASDYEIIPAVPDTGPNLGGDKFPVPNVEVEPGIIYIDGAHVVPGDRVLIQYSSDPSQNGVYEVKAVHVGSGQDVTLARVHQGDEVQTLRDRDQLGPYLNREIRRAQSRSSISYTPLKTPKPTTRPQKTWPKPRPRRGRR